MMKFLQPHHQELLKSSTLPVLFIDENEYQILSLKFVTLTDEALEEGSTSFLFQLNKPVLEQDHKTGQQHEYANDYLAWAKIRAQTEQEIELLSKYIEEVDNLEDFLYERKQPRYFLNLWFKLKRDISKLERILTRRSLVIKDYQVAKKSMNKEARGLIQELIYKLDAYAKTSSNQVQRLDSMQRFYESLKQERMNTNVYLLALVSTIFLPLNLIVGFFGINTENLYFNGNPLGTLYVLLILVGTFLLLIFSLPLIRIVDHFILNRFFGHYNFYSKISKRIETIAKRIEVP